MMFLWVFPRVPRQSFCPSGQGVNTVRFPVVHRVRTGQNTTMEIDGLLRAGLVAAVLGLLGSFGVIVWIALQNLN